MANPIVLRPIIIIDNTNKVKNIAIIIYAKLEILFDINAYSGSFKRLIVEFH